MRKSTKLLVLVLSMALLLGSIFDVASFAKEDDNGLSIEGATRTRVDFTDVEYDVHLNVNATYNEKGEQEGVVATPSTSIGTFTIPGGDMITDKKYGHLRTVKSVIDDNTWLESLFEEDDTAGA